jgi:hypothetical protein
MSGSMQARRRLQVVLDLMAGRARVAEACQRLGVGPTRLDQLRSRALQAALDALEPRPGGRPRHQPEANPGRVAELEARVAELEMELALSRACEELAGVHPQPGEKKKRKRRRGR